jgi:hypothetical protein
MQPGFCVGIGCTLGSCTLVQSVAVLNTRLGQRQTGTRERAAASVTAVDSIRQKQSRAQHFRLNPKHGTKARGRRVADRVVCCREHRLDAGRLKPLPAVSEWSDFNDGHGV